MVPRDRSTHPAHLELCSRTMRSHPSPAARLCLLAKPARVLPNVLSSEHPHKVPFLLQGPTCICSRGLNGQVSQQPQWRCSRQWWKSHFNHRSTDHMPRWHIFPYVTLSLLPYFPLKIFSLHSSQKGLLKARVMLCSCKRSPLHLE